MFELQMDSLNNVVLSYNGKKITDLDSVNMCLSKTGNHTLSVKMAAGSSECPSAIESAKLLKAAGFVVCWE